MEKKSIRSSVWRLLLVLTPIFLLGTVILNSIFHWTIIENFLYYSWNLSDNLILFLFVLAIIILAVILFAVFLKVYNSSRRSEVRFERIKNITNRKLMTGLVALILIVVIIGSFGTMIYSFSLWNYRFYSVGPYLTWANDQEPSDSITVCWRTKVPTGSSVRYGLSIDNLDKLASVEGTDIYHFVAIDGLTPNTLYYYEVIGQKFGIKEFKTSPARGQAVDFTFNVWADPRTNAWFGSAINQPNIVDYMANHMASTGTRNAFSIVAGDITSTGPSFDTWALYLKDLTTRDFGSNASNINAVGNHEHHEDPELRNFRNYYPYEQGNFSFVYGQLYVLVIDIYNYDIGEWRGVNFPQEQFEWAKADLEANADIPFKIIVLHPSPINYGNFSVGGHNANISTEIFYLCENYGIDAVISGHSHHYEVHELKGTYYFMIGIGGNPNRYHWVYGGWPTEVTAAGGTTHDSGGRDTGWLRIDMKPNEMHIRPIMIDGTEYKSYKITNV